jgi:hypothetical protein
LRRQFYDLFGPVLPDKSGDETVEDLAHIHEDVGFFLEYHSENMFDVW